MINNSADLHAKPNHSICQKGWHYVIPQLILFSLGNSLLSTQMIFSFYSQRYASIDRKSDVRLTFINVFPLASVRRLLVRFLAYWFKLRITRLDLVGVRIHSTLTGCFWSIVLWLGIISEMISFSIQSTSFRRNCPHTYKYPMVILIFTQVGLTTFIIDSALRLRFFFFFSFSLFSFPSFSLLLIC